MLPDGFQKAGSWLFAQPSIPLVTSEPITAARLTHRRSFLIVHSQARLNYLDRCHHWFTFISYRVLHSSIVLSGCFSAVLDFLFEAKCYSFYLYTNIYMYGTIIYLYTQLCIYLYLVCTINLYWARRKHRAKRKLSKIEKKNIIATVMPESLHRARAPKGRYLNGNDGAVTVFLHMYLSLFGPASFGANPIRFP